MALEGFIEIRCDKCLHRFAVLADVHACWKKGNRYFWCPVCGEKLHYVETETDRLRKELERAWKSRDYWMKEHQVAKQQEDAVRRRLHSQRGATTALRRKLQALRGR